MDVPKWDRSGEAWTTTVQCPAYGAVEVIITTEGEASPPSEKQVAALSLIARLDKSARKTIKKDVKRYAKENLDEEELEDFEGEDFDVEFNFALIPNLQKSEHAYYFISGDSDMIDIEHGIACLCRNNEVFRVCHTDSMYESYPCDDTETLDALLTMG